MRDSSLIRKVFLPWIWIGMGIPHYYIDVQLQRLNGGLPGHKIARVVTLVQRSKSDD